MYCSAGCPRVSGDGDPLNRSGIKQAGLLPLFDPRDGRVIAEPPGEGEGFWAGGPSALWDEGTGLWLLSYRLRTPLRDRGWSGRGEETVIAASADGLTFERVWSAHKDAFEALSIEKSCLVRSPDGPYRLYVSYSSRHDFRWRIDMLETEDVRDFDPSRRVTVLSPQDTGTEGVKDPVIYIVGGMWYLYANMAPRPEGADWAKLDRMHRESNAFVSGEVACPTGLAMSPDGVHFGWQGEVISCGDSWDRYLARISALVYTPPCFTAFYDGRPNSGANYSDSPGLAITYDLRTFYKLDPDKPRLRSPFGRGTLRYVEAVRVSNRVHYFYEMEREDYAHDLRTAVVVL
ncbi:MAG: hypothetical protein H5T69_00940 [Chloroflexi bacterium]|nr:hypothetical protein [Chloroflexota bacterium]